MARNAIAPTTPPTIAPVWLLPPEGDPPGEEEAGSVGRGVVVGPPVGGELAVLLPVGPVLEELDAPINAPGPISGPSRRQTCEESRKKKRRENFLPPADIELFIFQLFSIWHATLVHV